MADRDGQGREATLRSAIEALIEERLDPNHQHGTMPNVRLQEARVWADSLRALLALPTPDAKAHDAEVTAAALNAAADLWRNEGRAVMFNRDRLDLTPEGRVGKWLRDRASQYARADESNPR